MFHEIGQFCLSLGLAFCGVQVLALLILGRRYSHGFVSLGYVTAKLQALFLSGAFLTLMLAFICNDFSLLLVSQHSHTQMPFLYRLGGAWANHEGSLLLWVWLQACVGGSLVGLVDDDYSLKRTIIGIQGLLSFGLLLFLFFASNPFEAHHLMSLQGEGLNPLLQDHGLLFHPPILYMGYVGFSVAYCFAIAGLVHHQIDGLWAQYLRPWVLVSWGFLTFGVLLGSIWAYYELGWGGWWFWDPVENISLIPWFLGLGLFHALISAEKQKGLYGWALFLAIMTFGSCLIGTFFVRSGLIVSVHTFALNQSYGLPLFSYIGSVIVLGLGLLWGRKATFQKLPFENSLRLQSFYFLTLMVIFGASVIILGTFYPFIIEMLLGRTLAVGSPYYELVFIPLMLPLLMAIPIGPFLTWQRDTHHHLFKQLAPALTVSLFLFVLSLYGSYPQTLLTSLVLAISVWITVGTILKWKQSSFKVSTLPLIFGHMGAGIAVMGMTLSTSGKREITHIFQIGQTMPFAGFEVKLEQVTQDKGQNFAYEQANISVKSGSKFITRLTPQRRIYEPQDIAMKETSFFTNGYYNLYGVLGDYYGQNRWQIRLQYHPFVPLIWIGGAMMGLAGFIAASKRFKILLQKKKIALSFLMAFFLKSLWIPTVSADANQENLARKLEKEIRCPVCLGQTIEDSETPIAIEIRKYILSYLNEGYSVEEIRDLLRNRFGDEISLLPTMTPSNWILWFCPFVLFGLIIGLGFRRQIRLYNSGRPLKHMRR